MIFLKKTTMISFCDKTFNPADRWGERNGTGYWMVGPVDDLSDRVFLEENTMDLDQMISEYNTTTEFGKMMREFCLKKIYPGIIF